MRFFKVTEAYASFDADPEVHDVIGDAYDVLKKEAENRDIDTIRCGWAAQYLSDGLDAVTWGMEFPDSNVVLAGTKPDPERTAINNLRNATKEPLRPAFDSSTATVPRTPSRR